MGTYDSFIVTYQGNSLEVQTHRLDDAMAVFRPGRRVLPSNLAPGWKNFVEDFNAHGQYFNDERRRLLVVLMWNGVWLDHTFAMPDRREEAAQALMDVWNDHRYSTWGHGRWAEYAADTHDETVVLWRDLQSLINTWMGGFSGLRRFVSPPSTPLPTDIPRQEVSDALEKLLTEHRVHQLAKDTHWPLLMREIESENPEPQEDLNLGLLAVPVRPVRFNSRWALAAQALLAGQWSTVEALVKDERPEHPVKAWQQALNTTLAEVMASNTLLPLTLRLLEWGAVPPEKVGVSMFPLHEWAVLEQGWPIELLEHLRVAHPHLAWSSLWTAWDSEAYTKAWEQRPEEQRWPLLDVEAWVDQCAGIPTLSMEHLHVAMWKIWNEAGGRTSAEDPERDPLMRLLATHKQVPPTRVQWLIEHRDEKGWTVPHVQDLEDRLKKLANDDQPWKACWSSFESLKLHRSAAKIPLSTGKPSRKRL